jgi:hypothetical protein
MSGSEGEYESDLDSDYFDDDDEGYSSSDSSLDELSDSDCGGDSILDRVNTMIEQDTCTNGCLAGKGVELEQFLTSMMNMTKAERKISLMSVLAMLMDEESITFKRKRGKGEETRVRFSYHVPLVGKVCRDVFCVVYGVSTATIKRYRSRISGGFISLSQHGNTNNDNAEKVDVEWLKSWFLQFAQIVGDVVPLRVRRQKKIDGRVVKTVSHVNHVLLPSYFTWSRLHQEMELGVEESCIRRYIPKESTFRLLLQKHCPEVQIRSPRDHVCDTCVIYKNKMGHGASINITEELGKHTEQARRMR